MIITKRKIYLGFAFIGFVIVLVGYPLGNILMGFALGLAYGNIFDRFITRKI